MVNHHEGKHDDGFRRHTSRITSHLSSSDLLPLRGRKGGRRSRQSWIPSLWVWVCVIPGNVFLEVLLIVGCWKMHACARVCFFPPPHTSKQPLSSTRALFKLLPLFATLGNFQIGFCFSCAHYYRASLQHTHTEIFLPWLPHQDEIQPNKRSAATCCRYGAKLMKNFSAN